MTSCCPPPQICIPASPWILVIPSCGERCIGTRPVAICHPRSHAAVACPYTCTHGAGLLFVQCCMVAFLRRIRDWGSGRFLRPHMLWHKIWADACGDDDKRLALESGARIAAHPVRHPQHVPSCCHMLRSVMIPGIFFRFDSGDRGSRPIQQGDFMCKAPAPGRAPLTCAFSGTRVLCGLPSWSHRRCSSLRSCQALRRCPFRAVR